MKISIVGSAKSSGYSETAEKFAVELGRELAKRGHVLLYGPEIKMPSLSYMAAKEAKKNGGITVAIAIGRARTPFFDQDAATITIYTDGSGGAGREVILANSADGVISIGGGSGTLTEMSIAYMNNIPVVALKGSGGWSDKMIGQYFDSRKKYLVYGAENAVDALQYLEQLYANNPNPKQSLNSALM